MLEEYMPLVLISGIMCTERLWEKQISSFPKYMKVVVPKVTQKKTIHDLAAEIIKQNGPRFNVVGFSSGGYIAQEIIRQSPETVNKLMLMNTSGGNYSQQQQIVRKNFISICESQGLTIGLCTFVEKINSTYLGSNSMIVEFNKKMLEESSAEIFFWQFKAVYDFNITAPLLEIITCPTTVVASDNDPFISKDAYEEMKKSIPHAEIRVFRGGGHMLPVSRSDKIFSLMMNFFNYPMID